MNKKRFGAFSVLTALALALTSLVAPAHAAAKNLVIWADSGKAPVIKKAVAPWASAHGVTVNVVVKDFGKVRDELITAGPKGLGPDILVGPHDWLGSVVASGALARMTNVNKGAFSGPVIDAMSYKGLLYGVPMNVENIALIVNTDLVPTAPKTLTDLETTCAALKAAGKTKVCLEIPKGDPYHFYPLYTALGGYVFGWKNGFWSTKDIGIASSTLLANASKIDDYYSNGILSKDSGYDFTQWYAGKAAFMVTGPWNIGNMRKQTAVKYSVVPFPSGPAQSRPFMGVNGLYLSKFAPNTLVARDFLSTYATTADFQLAVYKDLGTAPALLAAQSDASVTSNKELAGFASFSGVAQPMPNIPQMGSVWGDWGNAWGTIADGKAKAAAAFTLAATNIKKSVG
jgi:arabinogalactan oligomer/maltooligosaccharide transport system substrate-binding protein